MAKYTGPKCRICRREGEKLYLKGEKCYTDKCAIEKRPYPPGEAGQSRRRQSEFGLQLREKQKVRRTYGLMEDQFRRVYKEAARRKGNTGELLLQLLERRLDNIVYRMGFANSRAEARQVIRHNQVQVNGGRVNVPSYQVNAGDEIVVAEGARQQGRIQGAGQRAEDLGRPEWLQVDAGNFKGTVKSIPERSELSSAVNEHLIVELYSK
ncbi:30S ribosomal protein S4 [Thiohalorhabdus denitrificans]|uniref:Small ribosomal subunit protein uS4 n=1 Tax=Thiohalorhabdus denitrificans TaxID=381306 RepID=A0A0P9C7S6_9GAMM|nr:30S ribosomal protein S4 [Thiohalorhabdus denitrificans]KPV40979.1 30S ribosomal protein S4 [Thiohalorhabdus denitrificans]SCY42822.1 small subunit ribosomal protein S4 [Thiohalorhabdus denitrificans]